MRACMNARMALFSNHEHAERFARGRRRARNSGRGRTAGARDEGMWTFDNFPAERMSESVGWAPDAAWRDRVMATTARLPQCSAAVVSEAGLLLTNQHCIVACLTHASTPDRNLVVEGYAAPARENELSCGTMPVQVLEAITDVTPRIRSSRGASDAGKFRARARSRHCRYRLRMRRREPALRSDDALRRWPLRALSLSPLHRCALGVRAGIRSRAIRRRRRQFQNSRAPASISRSCACTNAARQRGRHNI